MQGFQQLGVFDRLVGLFLVQGNLDGDVIGTRLVLLVQRGRVSHFLSGLSRGGQVLSADIHRDGETVDHQIVIRRAAAGGAGGGDFRLGGGKIILAGRLLGRGEMALHDFVEGRGAGRGGKDRNRGRGAQESSRQQVAGGFDRHFKHSFL